MYINIKKGTEQTHLYYSWYIPYICSRSTYGIDIHGIYHVYTMNIPCIYMYTPYAYMMIYFKRFLSQVFEAPIDQPRLPLMAHLTTCQIHTTRLILIYPIHNQCWKHSCLNYRSRQNKNTGHYLHLSKVFLTLPVLTMSTPSLLLLRRRRVRFSCYPFDMEHHRFRGRNVKVYTYTWYMLVYNMYTLVIYYVYVCNILYIYMD